MDGVIKRQIVGLRVAGTIFTLMALAQAFRLVSHFEVIVAGHSMPLWPSGLAVIVLGALAGWMWSLASVKS